MNSVRLAVHFPKINVQLQFSRKFCSETQQFFSLKACVALLQSCAKNQELSKGIEIHAGMVVSGYLGSPVAGTGLINMYSKCNAVADAVSVFYATADVHNVFVYNSIISGLGGNDLLDESFEFYRRMRLIGLVPDKFTFPCVIKSCSSIADLKNVHGLVFKHELNFDLFIGSALVHSYLKFELISDALEVFDGLPVRNDVVLWNAVINGHVQIGEFVKALALFRKMIDTGLIPNRFTITGVLSALALAGELNNGKLLHGLAIKMGYDSGVAVLNALIDVYGKCRQLGDAFMIFESMIDKDMYSWNSIISVHEQCGDHDGTLRLLNRMISSGFRPDLVTVTAVIPACSHLSALMHGRELHGYIVVNGLSGVGSTYTSNAIMDMYAKCGSLREARLVFDGMEIKDMASWNIMIKGCGMHGLGNEAFDLFSHMCEAGFKPDEVSFVGVLAACSHGGFVSQARELIAEMKPRYGVIPGIEHYACVIDSLGRAGKLEEAFQLITNMPIKPNQVVWRAFLAACRLHGNADLAKFAVEQVLELDPEHCGNYVLMSNICGAAGKYEEVAELRHTMAQQDVRKSPGCSWIELSDGMHAFFNADQTNPLGRITYEGLDSLTACLREHGYTLDVMDSCF